MLENSVSSFLQKAASRSPAPGGGCIAALAGAMGASMASMAANFTVGKKGYESVLEEAAEILKTSESARLELLELAEQDIKSYEKVSAAYKLPAENPEQKKTRKEIIRESLLEAMKAPFETASRCADVIRLLPRLAEIGNKNLVSDVGVAACLLNAAVESAALNVEINLKALADEKLTAEKRSVVEGWLSESKEIADSVMLKVKKGVRA
jgi:formiminotetrahydrofolate cyclodeaminase